MIDAEGFRPNVGIILTNPRGKILWARRVGGHDAWQFPQGGIQRNESPEAALYRELYEEVGLQEADVDILACTRGWLRYRLPRHLVRHQSKPLCIGQKQKWFLLRHTSEEHRICLDRCTTAEFDSWRWVSYWYPLNKVVSFKRDVYRRALKELAAPYFNFQKRVETIALDEPAGPVTAIDERPARSSTGRRS
ncbi:RNA pyrophosphohydrolase [Gilvimarinus sp. F26214L]|uniref:RNA pyrophosphohydrolase n=1 Tax=Gilvimarinus sp. DZF01 TaxID=3461371 RepID=UPI004045DD57